MASENGDKRKCFTFIWKLENASYCWQSGGDFIESPSFTVDEIYDTNWKLEIFPSIVQDKIGFYLQRQTDNKSVEKVKIDCDLAFLSSDGEVQYAFEKKNVEIGKTGWVRNDYAPSRNEMFLERKPMFLSKDTLTVRCRMWKSVGEMSQDILCFARTRILVEKRSFLWCIENFSTLKHTDKKIYKIKSLDNGENFMSLELFLSGGLFSDETILFRVTPHYPNIKIATFKLSIVDASKNAVYCFQDEFWYADSCGCKDFTLIYTKSELLEKKNTYLPDDVLSLSCECTFCFGTMQQEIEKVDSDCIAEKKEPDNSSVGTENEFSDPKCVLLDNLKSMFNSSCVSDVKLKTKSQVYPAHKCILSARSPVFKAMFSNDMREKTNECVDIEDLSDDTVSRMLRFIYNAEIEELEWVSGNELYEAADRYQILNLKDICSSFLKSNLCANNSCEALLLADLHQDKNLKGFVQKFILSHGEDIINSEEWGQLVGTNVKLAYETLLLKFKKSS